MRHIVVFIFLTLNIIISCARISSPNGGPIDKTPPILVKTSPENYTTNFNTSKIEIQFNEYVDIKDLSKHFIISPPLEKKPIIKPENITTKKISILLNGDLKPNTTYALNFGNSIQDHNEGNILRGLNYVFSTGKTIDSLTIEGTIKDELENIPQKNINILLFKDRPIDLNKTPDYYYNTQENSDFKIEHLPEGNYEILAMEDINQNSKYDIGIDKIAFLSNPVNLTKNQKIADLNLFKEKPKGKVFNPIQSNKNQLLIGYQGNLAPSIKIKNLSSEDYILTKKSKTDSLLVSFKKDLTNIELSTSLNEETKEYNLNLLKKPIDSLKTTHSIAKLIRKKDPIIIEFNNPISTIYKELISVINDKGITIPFNFNYNEYGMFLNLLFDQKPGTNYQIKLAKNSIKDFLGTSLKETNIPISIFNDYELSEIHLNIENPSNKQLIVEVLNVTNNCKESIIYNGSKGTLKFTELIPDKYTIKIIEDANQNGIFDTGDFQEKKQPESIYNFQKIITLRMNSEIHENITIK